jgi:polysaccharide deacetylase 2 family uncharacterized protein YibQ
MSEARKKVRKRTTRRRRPAAGEWRLVVTALAIIAVAASSIGAMLALQYRSADTPLAEIPAVADAGSTGSDAAPRALPVYEEPLEPAALEPPPASPALPPLKPVAAPLPADRSAVAWRKYGVPVAQATDDRRPKIAVVIDDLGVDRARSDRSVALPGPLTMAWLPYAHDLPAQTAAARRAGHELLVHVPMDPRNRAITDPGPNALLIGLEPAELQRRIDWNLSQFGSYVGINNHMGSRFTGEVEAMAPVMRALRARGLVYLDSRTSSRSAAPTAAHEAGVPVVVRDVFIDHERTSEAVASALATVEEVARRNGRAIAIGHPRDVTIAALTRWLPRLEANGFRLVPLSAIVAELYPPGGPD